MPSEARRKRYSTSAGKPLGVSWTTGRISSAPATTTTNAANAAIAAFHAPSDGSSERRIRPAAIAADTEITIIRKYNTVRRPLVSGLPIVGGLAGYFVNGTITIVRYAPSAS